MIDYGAESAICHYSGFPAPVVDMHGDLTLNDLQCIMSVHCTASPGGWLSSLHFQPLDTKYIHDDRPLGSCFDQTAVNACWRPCVTTETAAVTF